MIRLPIAFLALVLPFQMLADEEIDRKIPGQPQRLVPDPLTVRALERLEKRMGVEFKIPFPAQFDIDAYQKRPLAILTIGGSKISATRPIINPYDEPYKVEWMLGPENPAKLLEDGFDCSFDLDEHGEFSGANLVADWASDGTSSHQIMRGETESGRDFFERARLTYRSRAENAKDPEFAKLLVTAFEKIAIAIQTLRKEEEIAPTGSSFEN